MDARLVSWARSVKSRQRYRAVTAIYGSVIIWLFTDAARLANPLPAVARLPKGLGGVVFRHDGVPGRAALGRSVARLCRQRRLQLVVAGDWRLAMALGARLHLRGGRLPAGCPKALAGTSSAHGVADLLRAHRSGAKLAFLSPAFASASHPGGAFLGVLRWGLAARRGAGPVGALGGIDAASVRRLPRQHCVAAGAIGAFVA
jgi:thiamine-phosphate pyrophosphorylase